MSILGLGLIGAGRWGRRYISTLAALPDVRLARLASANPESARLVPATCGITDNWREVAGDSSLAGVIIATPPSLHAEMAEVAMAAGVPVLIEKPMTLSLSEARHLVSAASRYGCPVLVGHTHLFSAAYRMLKERGRELGPLLSISAHAGNHGPFRPDTPMLWDWAPHDFAMCLDLIDGEPADVDVSKVGVAQLPGGLGEAHEIHLTFADGVVADIRVSNIDDDKSRYFEAKFKGGTLIYDDLAPHKLHLVKSGETTSTPVAIDDSLPLSNLVVDFCDAIRAKFSTHPSLDLGLRVVKLLDRCDRQLSATGGYSELDSGRR